MSNFWDMLPKQEWLDWERAVLFSIEGLRQEGFKPPFSYNQIAKYMRSEGLDYGMRVAYFRNVGREDTLEGFEVVVKKIVGLLFIKGIVRRDRKGVYPLWVS